MKKILLSFLTIAVIFLTGLQGLVPNMPLKDASTSAPIISAVLIFLVLALTAWKQFLSDVIQNKSLYATLLVALLATVGGLADLFNVLPFDASTAQWLRFGITVVALGLNVTSKALFTTSEVAAVLFAVLMLFGLPGCSLGNLIKSDCQVQYNVPSSVDSSSYLCLKCKNKIILDAEDSIRLRINRK